MPYFDFPNGFLNQALIVGEPEGYLRTFLDEGEALHKVGLQLIRQQPENLYLRRILQHFAQIASKPVPLAFGETVSQREIDVLSPRR
jgi:LuxR family transcriptional regulator, maltose regulon positive regulatory protein